MNRYATAALAAFTTLAMAAPAQAAVIQVNHVLDQSSINTSIDQEPLANPFTAGIGDRIEYLVTFPSEITFDGDTSLWLLSLTNSGEAGIETAFVWEFLSPSANLVSGPIVGIQSNEQVHVGTYLNASQYRLDANPISFSGIRLSIDLLSNYDVDLDNDGAAETTSTDPREYRSIALSLGNGSAVPEPATWLLLMGGIGVVGGALRRRGARAAAFA